MTYGDTGGALRHELATLLRQHRIQQRLGGPGLWTVPETTTLEQRKTLGEQISRYRHAVLNWCLQAVAATGPDIGVVATGRSADPVEELRHRVTNVIEASPAGLPPLSELTSKQPFEILETWRQAARAAALGEHDFAAGVGYGSLDERQRRTVITDLADIVQALVVLDKRYDNIPSWRSLREPGRLSQAAAACAEAGGYAEQGFTVDLRGWSQPPAVINDPPLPEIGGVLQAVHNTLIHLAVFPTARNLRIVIDSQALLSHEAAVRVQVQVLPPRPPNGWRVSRRLRSLFSARPATSAGLVGRGRTCRRGGHQLPVSRLRRLRSVDLKGTERLHHIDRLFTRVDRRVGDIIEQGTRMHLYFLRGRLPRLASQSAKPRQATQERYGSRSRHLSRPRLLAVVRSPLRPHPGSRGPSPRSREKPPRTPGRATPARAGPTDITISANSSHVRVVGLWARSAAWVTRRRKVAQPHRPERGSVSALECSPASGYLHRVCPTADSEVITGAFRRKESLALVDGS